MTTAKWELSPDGVRSLLAELGQALVAEGVQATIYIAGGAAIALTLDTDRITADVDAVFQPATEVRAIATAIAAAHGLPANWLNDSIRAFLPGNPADDTAAVLYDVPGLSVAIASPEHLLAMKLAAYRPGKDQADLELLFRELGIDSAEAAADIAQRVYGPYGEDGVVLPDRAELILSAQAILDRRSR